jgi:hypothetical protein
MNGIGAAWLAAAIALGLHVVDEAATDFLRDYNPVATRIRARLHVPFPPTFSFWPWLIGLLVVTAILLALTPLAFANERRLRGVAVFLGVIHTFNGLLHIGAAIRLRRRVPGLTTAPLLLLTGVWLLAAVSGAL